MKKMKRLSVFLAALCAVSVFLVGVMPAKAASAEVTFEVKETDINVAVTVPSQVPIVFNEDGTNTYPQNWTIANKSQLGAICLDQVELTQAEGGWMFADTVVNMSLKPADTRVVKFYIGKPGNLKIIYPDGAEIYPNGVRPFFDNEIAIPAGDELTLEFKVERTAFTESIDMHKAFDMELKFSFI